MKDMTQHITFVTGNSRKVEEATAVLAEYAIDVTPLALELDEIQHHDPLKITETKARAAYQAAGRPIVVNDSNWEVPALGGFPGGYMKDIAIWFRPEDFLALMRDKADRRVILHDVVVYYDGNVMQCFTFDQLGVFTKEARGSRQPYANNNVIAMEGSTSAKNTCVFS